MSPKKIDLLINCQWIIPIIPKDSILKDCAIAIDAGSDYRHIPPARGRKKIHCRQSGAT